MNNDEGGRANPDWGMSPDELLVAASETFAERNPVYGNLYARFGTILREFFPSGITLSTAGDFDRFSLFLSCVSKLARYANHINTGGHQDSARDLIVYAAMLEGAINE